MDLQLFASKIYLSVIFNWPTICQNQQVMDALDMNKNTLCVYHKAQNPNLANYMIQSFVFSIMLTIWFFSSMPINTDADPYTESYTESYAGSNANESATILSNEQWATIKQNKKIMDILDMDMNQLCKYHKEMNPLLNDSDIQMHVFLMVLVVMIIIATPFNAIFHGGVDYLKKSIESHIWLLNNEIPVD